MARSKPRLLVVEDDGGIRGFLADHLTQYELVFATCQSECYALLDTPEYDLILLDLRLPRTPGEMKPTNKVGIDILDEVRRRGLTKRRSAMPMPVVIMTAHGSETLSVSMIKDHDADDYIPKSFGVGSDLEHKIKRALEGDASLRQRARSSSTVHLSFHPDEAIDIVRVETITYRGTHCKLLRRLRDQYLKDQQALLRDHEFHGISAAELAAEFEINDQTLMKRIWQFRKDVKRDFKKAFGRSLDDNDIIENRQRWEGYRLNPAVVRVVRWVA